MPCGFRVRSSPKLPTQVGACGFRVRGMSEIPTHLGNPQRVWNRDTKATESAVRSQLPLTGRPFKARRLVRTRRAKRQTVTMTRECAPRYRAGGAVPL